MNLEGSKCLFTGNNSDGDKKGIVITNVYWDCNLVFFETPEVDIIGIFVSLEINKLEIVAKQKNMNTNFDLSSAYWLKTNVTCN